jgi:CRISPR system Cascade subunit CasE
MYLSRIFIPWYPGQNPYNWHQQLWNLFPVESSRRNEIKKQKDSIGEKVEFPTYFLFRVEDSKPGQGTDLLVQSPVKPALDSKIKIVNGPGELLYKRIVNGTVAKFTLTANPVKMKCADQNRVPHIGEENLVNWLKCKIIKFGNLDQELNVTPNQPIYFRKGNNTGKINPVTFEGNIEIFNSEEFVKSAFTGIGPAKSFGCGLMLVKKI